MRVRERGGGGEQTLGDCTMARFSLLNGNVISEFGHAIITVMILLYNFILIVELVQSREPARFFS